VANSEQAGMSVLTIIVSERRFAQKLWDKRRRRGESCIRPCSDAQKMGDNKADVQKMGDHEMDDQKKGDHKDRPYGNVKCGDNPLKRSGDEI